MVSSGPILVKNLICSSIYDLVFDIVWGPIFPFGSIFRVSFPTSDGSKQTLTNFSTFSTTPSKLQSLSSEAKLLVKSEWKLFESNNNTISLFAYDLACILRFDYVPISFLDWPKVALLWLSFRLSRVSCISLTSLITLSFTCSAVRLPVWALFRLCLFKPAFYTLSSDNFFLGPFLNWLMLPLWLWVCWVSAKLV